MGKVKTRFLGLEDVEKQQKKEQKAKKIQKESTDKKPEKIKLDLISQDESEQKEVKVEKKPEGKAEKKAAPAKKKKFAKARIRGKKYQEASKLVDENKTYSLSDALKILKKMKLASFDQSVELHLNVTKEGMRGELELPHTTGKTVRVRIVDDKTLKEIADGKIEFDILVTHPSNMPKLAPLARILGPKGLMPNPKTGTITDKPEEVAKKFEKGMLRWKGEPKFPLVHLMVGKISHEEKALSENASALLNAVGEANVKEAYVKTTMSPSLRLNLEQIFA